jgi:glucokinase
MKHFVVGVDVGGTNIKFGIIDGSSKILARSSLSTKKLDPSPRHLLAAISQEISSILGAAAVLKKDVRGVGIGFPGLVDVSRGVVRLLPNIPGWKNVPVKRILGSRLRLAVRVENDVNMITLGEWKCGAGRGGKNLVCMTLGTGVGAGLVLDNDLFRGPGFAAGEIGHAPLNEDGPRCGCGGYGCFESYVGNAPLHQRAAVFFRKKGITLEEVSHRASRGNREALRFWREVGTRVGNGLVGTVNLLNPESIVIGGGVASSFEFFAPAIRDVIRSRAMRTQGGMVRVVRAKLGNDAGLIGAMVLVNQT